MTLSSQEAYLLNLGLMEYEEALEFQKKIRQKRHEKKIPNTILFCHHSSVFTLGKRDCSDDFILSPQEISQRGIPIIQSNRGGKITYHGPGQVVVYFIIDLRQFQKTIPQLVWLIEEWVILTLKEFNIEAQRDSEYPGVWVGQAKISALGLHISHGLSMHGLSLNVCPDLSVYQWVHPCGIKNREVTSMTKVLGHPINCEEVEKVMKKKLPELFPFVWKVLTKEEILIKLQGDENGI